LDEPCTESVTALPAASTTASAAPATTSVASNDSTVPAVNLVAADDVSCAVQSTTNSLGDADLATTRDEDDVEMLEAANRGVKRRWSFEENTVFKRAFQDALLSKKMPPGDEILSVSKEMKTRTVEQIRTRLNNIILGKQKWVF
jgi:hypothetical protein